MTTRRRLDDAPARARAWHHARHAAVCDVLEPWAHGTLVRDTRHPSYYDFNLVRVEEDPRMTAQALMAFADDALAGLAHRRLDFDLADAAELLRRDFETEGWKSQRLVWMRHEVAAPPGPDIAVEEVPYDAAHNLRVAWHREESPDQDPGDFPAQAREVALRRRARVLVVRRLALPVAFAQLEHHRAGAEITDVYVHPEHRGDGLGTAITRAAIEAAGAVRDLWIVADDEDRPKELYARLGFRPASKAMEFTRLP
jgi:ribosomal protein S18 acetylase RimI-like enzyme